MPHQLNASPAINAFLDKALPEEHPARAAAIVAGACRVCLQVRPDCLSSECPTGRRCHYRELANERFGALNPDTHCLTCGELLSVHGHCWQQHDAPALRSNVVGTALTVVLVFLNLAAYLVNR